MVWEMWTMPTNEDYTIATPTGYTIVSGGGWNSSGYLKADSVICM